MNVKAQRWRVLQVRLAAFLGAATLLAISMLTTSADAGSLVDRPAITGQLPEIVANTVGAQLAASHVPSAAFAVINDGRVVTGAVGPGVNAQTPFLLGSVSKSFTALAVLQLVDAGQVSLDEPVERYLVGFATATPGDVITVRHLLDQTSGLPSSAGLAILDNPQMPLDERVDDASTVTLDTAPGVQFQYSNLNYAILGRLVEQVSGRSFAAYIEQEIFEPLGMDHSFTSMALARGAGMPAASTVWFGHDVAHEPVAAPGALADGYLISTADDMSRYLRLQLGDGTVDGVRIVSREGLTLMHSIQTDTPPDAAASSTDAYGFGWGIGEINGERLVAHDGDLTGFHANVAVLPDLHRGIVVLVARNGILVDAGSSYRAGLQVLAGGSIPPVDDTFDHTYRILIAATVALALVLAASFVSRRGTVRTRLRRSGRRGLLVQVAGDLCSAVAIYTGVFVGIGFVVQGSPLTVGLAFSNAPDVTVIVLVSIVSLVVRAVLTAWWGSRDLIRGRNPAPESVPCESPAVGSSAWSLAPRFHLSPPAMPDRASVTARRATSGSRKSGRTPQQAYLRGAPRTG